MIGSLRFFNLKDLTFHDQASLYFIITTVRAFISVFASMDYMIFSLLGCQNAGPMRQFPKWITPSLATFIR